MRRNEAGRGEVTKKPCADELFFTGGSAAAAGSLVEKLGGKLLGYMFILEIDFLKGREKLNAPVHTLLSATEKQL